MTADLAVGLQWAGQPIISIYVPGKPATPPDFVFGGVAPAAVMTFPLEGDSRIHVTNYDLVFDELPTDLCSYIGECLRAASAAGDTVAWAQFEGSFGIDEQLSDEDAPQIYGACAPGGEPAVAPDPESRRSPAWLSVIRSFRSQL